MTTKICDVCRAQLDDGNVEEWLTVKWMPGLHLSPRHRFHTFQFREYCPKCSAKLLKAGNVDFKDAPENADGFDRDDHYA
ncbi:MAG: hypothetical protein V1723_00915 [Candidatus Uhrbacteria bacterium]